MIANIKYGRIVLCALFSLNTLATAATYTRRADGVIVHLPQGALKVQVCDERIIRVIYDPAAGFKPIQSMVVTKTWEPAPFTFAERGKTIELFTPKLRVRVHESGAVSFYQSDGHVLLRENTALPRKVTPAEVMGETTFHGQLFFAFSDDEALYGLGQHQDGVMNYRGHSVTLVQENTEVAIPFLLSTRNYGLLLDNYSKIIFDDRHNAGSFWLEVADQIDYYFIAGEDLDEVIRGYRDATGPAPLFAKWAYGYWQSKERYRTQQELLQVARAYRDRKIPVDNFVQDWQYWGEDWKDWSSMQFDSTRYPDPAGMMRQLHDKYHAHIMFSIWPVLGSATRIGQELQSQGLLYEPFHWTDGHTYDAYHPEARKIYWRYIDEGLFSQGADAWWMDATEPEVLVAPTERATKSIGRNCRGTAARYLNPYSLMTTAGVYEGQRAADSSKRVFILTRSAFAGQQRNAAATWSGDIVADWQVFRNQIPAGLNFCMSGIPYWSNDIGGFHVKRYGGFPLGCDDPGYRELYVRWFQYGAFNPIFRAHGTDAPREIWRFGEPGDWAYDSLIKYDQLRYRLLPYIYSLAWQVTSSGYTLMRGLAMDFAGDKNVHNIKDQYMFGPALLINPVTEHFYHGESYDNEIIPADCLYTENGKRGAFTARYYSGCEFDTLKVDSVQTLLLFDQYLGKEVPPQVRWDQNSKRWSGYIQAPVMGDYTFWLTSDDAVRFWLDDRLYVDRWSDRGLDKTDLISLHLSKGKKYHFRIDQARWADATKLRLEWLTPAMKQHQIDPLHANGMRRLYLPIGSEWFDFWTGEKFSGGKFLNRPVPIDIMPIYVRAGSILPLGPHLQYAAEKPADPLELRIYRGADGHFLLYEDQDDAYDYEQGQYATIPFTWHDREGILTIGERTGGFPGMLDRRTFHIVWAQPGHGIGVEPENNIDRVVTYEGRQLEIDIEK